MGALSHFMIMYFHEFFPYLVSFTMNKLKNHSRSTKTGERGRGSGRWKSHMIDIDI